MLGGPPRPRRQPEAYGSLEATLLHCPRCRQAMPVAHMVDLLRG